MRSSTTRAINLLWSSILLPIAAFSGDVKLTNADLELQYRKIVVTSSSTEADFKAALDSLGKTQSWHVELGGAVLNVGSVAIDLPDRAIDLRFPVGTFSVFDAGDIPKGELKVTYLPTTSLLTVPTGKDAHSDGAQHGFASCFSWGLTKDKKKADVDISGGLQAGVGAKPQYYWSVKATCPFGLGDGNKYGAIGPSFSGEASQQRNADPDSLKAGIKYKKIFAPQNWRNGFIVSGDALGYEFERNVKKEAVLNAGKVQQQQYLQKNTNLMWSGKAGYVNASRQLNWTLTSGFEAGKALSRTVKKDSQSSSLQPVARLYFEFDAYRTFFLKDKPVITFHGDQTMRLPFRQEPYTQADVNRGQMFLTDKPRHWSQADMTFPVTDGFGLNITYKRGSLPPSFEFVDHQITIGFNLLFKRK